MSLAVRSCLRLSPMRAAALSPRCNSTRLYSSTMHDNDPEVLEREKKRNLNRKEWNEVLASASEAVVKADKSKENPSELQSKTVESLRVQRSESSEAENGASSTTAFYSRDEVSGPLSGAVGKEEVIVINGELATDRAGADTILNTLEANSWMTPSEENVKADRGEI